MERSQMYILISIVALAVIAIVFIFTRKSPHKPFSKLTILAFCFFAVGIIFGENIMIGYSLTGCGVGFATIDIIRKIKKPK
jgi:sugar phosphate permease